ncbi:alpha/beta fold hydrolase [Rhodopila sp.]|uniref:alpha/beta fold hydrolase n=1 Tax=Rhodopila sp. TaxID=2480087 RepID=UPI003D14DC35
MANRPRRLETVSADAAKIVTCVDGEGQTLIMLPSYGRDGFNDFDDVTDRVAATGWRVLRPQPRGIAGSAGPMQGIDLKDLAADVAGVIRQLGGAPAVVLGHAFGNFVARVVAVEHPELVRGIILAAATSSPAKVAPEVNKAPFVAGDPTRPEEERLAALRLAFFAPGHDPRPWLDGWYPETLAMQRGAVEATNLNPYWDAGTAPILDIIPRHDPFNPPAQWSALHDKVGDRVTTVIIEDASHALFPEQPDRVADAVRQWSARL